MKRDQMSVFSTSLRAFFGSLFGILGLFIGILIVVLVVGIISSGAKEVDGPNKVTVLPDHTGQKKTLSMRSPLIILVEIKGIIGPGKVDTEKVRDQIERSYAFSKDRIKGVLLAIDSPGGSAFDSNSIYQIIAAYKEQLDIPVYAYTDGMCASGGYYIACAADKIIASNTSVIGSIGVKSTFFNVSDTLGKVGVKAKTLSQGIDKTALDPFTPWKEGADEGIITIMTALYDEFVDVVAANRPELSKDKLVKEYVAQVFAAAKAKQIGYIDAVLPTRNAALKLFVEELEMEDSGYQVVELVSKSWFEDLFKMESPLLGGKVQHKFSLPGRCDSDAPEGFLFLYN